MHLAELVSLRPEPCAGLMLTLTQRCPLRCAHCSSSSTMDGQQPDADSLVRFVGSFPESEPPRLVLMTGGEPLLRPDLVVELAAAARATGTRTALLTGAFFARDPRPPTRIWRAITAVDHVSVSIDVFHERQVSRHDVFGLLRLIRDAGINASLHLAGFGPDDPYLADLLVDVRAAFADGIPALVNRIRPIGRAASWAAAQPVPATDAVLPCAMAAWPVVAHDGVIVACCNQSTVDIRPVPPHLRLGHLGEDDWKTVRARSLSSPALRMIRAAGPRYLVRQPATGYCQACRGLDAAAMEPLRALAEGPAGELLDRHAASTQLEAGPTALLRRHGAYLVGS